MLTRPRPVPSTLAIGAVVVALAALTVALVVLPGAPAAPPAPVAEVAIVLAATVVAGGAALAAWVAHAALRAPYALALASGFLALAAAGGDRLVAELGHLAAPADLGLVAARAWGSGAGRVVGLLVLGAGLPVLATRSPRRPAALAILLLPAAAVLLAGLAAALAGPGLPPLATPADAGGVQATPAGTLLWAATVLAGLVAIAGGVASGATRDGRPGWLLLVALLVAAVAQIHYGLVADAGLRSLASADALMAVAAVLGLLAVVAQAAGGATGPAWQAEAAVAAERARLAREVHDGLAQDLWRARLRLEEVTGAGTLEDAREAAWAVDRLLGVTLQDARERIAALRAAGDEDLGDLLARRAQAFTATSGVPVEVEVQGGMKLPRATGTELGRIAGEALANIEKHADATLVRVEAWVEEDRVRMRISDNGVGFDVASAATAAVGRADLGGVGLDSMRERAAGAGGHVRIESAPYAGTTVTVELPVGAA